MVMTIVAAVIGLVLGTGVGYALWQSAMKKKGALMIAEAKKEAEQIKKDRILEAKEKFLNLKEEHERAVNKRDQQLAQRQNSFREKDERLKKSIQDFKREQRDLERAKETVAKKRESLDAKSKELDKLKNKQIAELEAMTGMTEEEAKEQMIQALKDKAKLDAQAHIQNTMEEANLTASQEAKKIVIQSIQRVATESAIENAVSVFNIENDDIKGKIIGREGRNIRAIEAATGVEIIVDDTPEAILLSCFDPVRREIARLSMHKLVSDGRIHPARVEEVVAKTRKQIEEEIVQTGKRTAIDLGIHGLHPELIKTVGRMKYRSSYGQNLLQHSREVANLCAIMASELGLNPKLAKRAGLLHDIGKVPHEETDLPHAILGMQWAEKYGEKPDVCNAIGAHHDEIEMTSMISPIVQVCDAISGARPGARRMVADSYIQRLKDLENLAYDFDGVTKAYAIQAGRELRVMVESEKVTDAMAAQISYDISQKIQTEMTYPGQVRVTVIRELRSLIGFIEAEKIPINLLPLYEDFLNEDLDSMEFEDLISRLDNWSSKNKRYLERIPENYRVIEKMPFESKTAIKEASEPGIKFELYNSAILTNYKESKYSIIKDFSHFGDDIPELSEASAVVSDLSASPLDPSQFGIIEDINTRNHVVVHGPPGTGKSQTITGIITSALANDLKVAVVCQKAAAIDVLIQNLGELGVDKEVLRITNVTSDRKAVAEKARAMEDAGIPRRLVKEVTPATMSDYKSLGKAVVEAFIKSRQDKLAEEFTWQDSVGYLTKIRREFPQIKQYDYSKPGKQWFDEQEKYGKLAAELDELFYELENFGDLTAFLNKEYKESDPFKDLRAYEQEVSTLKAYPKEEVSKLRGLLQQEQREEFEKVNSAYQSINSDYATCKSLIQESEDLMIGYPWLDQSLDTFDWFNENSLSGNVSALDTSVKEGQKSLLNDTITHIQSDGYQKYHGHEWTEEVLYLF